LSQPAFSTVFTGSEPEAALLLEPMEDVQRNSAMTVLHHRRISKKFCLAIMKKICNIPSLTGKF